jgi:hypothetical protein
MNENIQEILLEGEEVLYKANISMTFYMPIIKMYLLAIVLLYIGYEMELGIIGGVLLIRTFIININEVKEKASYSCIITNERLVIMKGTRIKEILPVSIKNIKTIFVKPFSERFKKYIDVGTLEVLSVFGGRYVIRNIEKPYDFHKKIIGEIIEEKKINLDDKSIWASLKEKYNF